jgi:hypothetical protein
MIDLKTLETYIWRGEKHKFGGEIYQETTRLVDCDQEKLQNFYNHCKTMLYNDNKIHPGRYVLLKIIADQRDRCGVELFLRDLASKKMSRFSFMESIREFLNNNREVYENLKKYNIENNLGPVTLEFIASGCGDEYKDLPLDLIIDACVDRLGE